MQGGDDGKVGNECVGELGASNGGDPMRGMEKRKKRCRYGRCIDDERAYILFEDDMIKLRVRHLDIC